jgi:prepilin-type N-terminal cleavage/methylation domain-containing protein
MSDEGEVGYNVEMGSFFATRHSPLATRAGFTLVEILVVTSIGILLAAYGFSYSSTSRMLTTLSVERARAGQFILKAKSLTLATALRKLSVGRPCGYGVRVSYGNPASLTLFSYSLPRDASPSGKEVCKDANGRLRMDLTEGADPERDAPAGETIVFERDVRLRADAGKLDRVFFLAPDPQTFIWTDGDGTGAPNATRGTLTLETADGKAVMKITVGFAGGVNF